ncbi:amidohydrolase family protein [bacterium]|nr:amidohydrolase family protein [bacterium]
MQQRKKYALINGVVTDCEGIFVENGGMLIESGKIARIGFSDEISALADYSIDVGGRLIIPGLANAHTHLYSALATALVPRGETSTFAGILNNLWWRLDSILDEEAIAVSARIGIIDSIKHGVTTIFDHHASMGFVRGSLETIESVFEEFGIRGVLCFETSERDGTIDISDHIAENIDFFEKHRDSDNIKGMFGLHANFTLCDKSLARIAGCKPSDMPIHIHCGEAKDDFKYCRSLGYDGPVQRIAKFGLLDNRSILAHCVHLSEEDYQIINDTKPLIVTNPESNWNNRVGAMNRERIPDYLFGTDGMSGDIISQARFQFLHGSNEESVFDELGYAIFKNRRLLVQKFFPNCGGLTIGSPADIAVLDYRPVTPINSDNVVAHLIFGAKNARAYWTIANGRIILKEGELTGIDEFEIVVSARKVAKKLHERFYG